MSQWEETQRKNGDPAFFPAGERFSPIAQSMVFVEAEAQVAMEAFVEWQRPLLATRGIYIKQQVVKTNTLGESLSLLLPLTAGEKLRCADGGVKELPRGLARLMVSYVDFEPDDVDPRRVR